MCVLWTNRIKLFFTKIKNYIRKLQTNVRYFGSRVTEVEGKSCRVLAVEQQGRS